MKKLNDALKKLLMKFKLDHWVGLLGILIGGAIAFGTTYWDRNVAAEPSLSIEINSIKRRVPEGSGVTLDGFVEFDMLTKQTFEPSFMAPSSMMMPPPFYTETAFDTFGNQKTTYNPDELRWLAERARSEFNRLPEGIKTLQERVRSMENLLSRTVDHVEIEQFFLDRGNIISNVFYAPNDSDDVKSDMANQFANDFLSHQKRDLKQLEARYSELQSKLPLIERRIETIIDDLISERSVFEVSITLINSGKSNISIKQPALLRVYIGTGNYVDMRLRLDEYSDASGVSEQSTRVGIFTSDQISTLPLDDQKLINTYWGQSVQSIFFVEDILGEISSSHPIAFSEGVNEKIIFDRLKRAASLKLDP